MWNYYGGHMFGWGIFGWLMMVFVWAVPIILIAWVLRGGIGSKENNGKSALDVLNERYAKGDIGKEEFESKKKDIQQPKTRVK